MPEIAELAKSARSSCKKCKEKIEKGALRLGKQYDDANGHTMTSWYHPQLSLIHISEPTRPY